ncbi:hypothetical protein AAL_01992 [Moelleriella libera RCEF 2490]|uniref:Uncharacterized protein n=1 Tax=Moelleriella libera RCEF 2490 TaxID=1081109 RepID=A0A166PVX8_9HYPO|nr:hypothetical protein AAL_01992 [Moelleriella libera RCEF 2490]
MFATQQYAEGVDTGRKRLRDDEDAANAATGFGEHRNKRLQSLPFRTCPRPNHQSILSSIEPLNASPASSGPRHHVESWTPPHASESPSRHEAEVEMMDATASLLHDNDHLSRTPESHQDRLTGRMPTPIQPSFAAQVRGQNGAWAAGQMPVTPNGIANLGHQVTGVSSDQSVPRALNSANAWQMLQHNRRLPSPISETGDCGTSGQDNLANGMMVDDEGFPSMSDPFQCSPSGHPSPTHVMEHPNATMDTDNQFASHHHHHHHHHHDQDADPSSPSPGRKGHQRSKHTVNSWTWQPGMKRSFSIGYRADCEKCRLKVPGHFNHIVIS